ncbi:putative secreted protein with PEP-CTERM sorting signal [Plasticicumulans lactativorans]|uniref:Putative secreted protein with PEP-CTERM sorting signal n=1 Tax=Plasticicumulans lactativorans TaxID=1133106 RepID=A0A4R2L083_9GAMM|nr:hypothetical protein [Plasticicumulans lactativorans]TCO79633.1 putative secreted protein with PEP-CTERM sorting signal [Plasticicumulans lactativorans]
MNTFPSPAGRTPVLLLALILSSLSPRPGSAALLGVDLLSSGDQRLTRDTATWLDWLDLTATLNLSAQDIQDGMGGWKSRGFVHATISDVRTLFLHADPPNIVINTGANPLSAANVDGAQRLLQLMGVTSPGPSDNDFDILGNGIAGVGEPGAGYAHLADYGTNTDGTLGFFFVPDGIVFDTFSDAQVGNFLIRPIPEPSAAWLLGAGLAALSGTLRNMTRRCPMPRMLAGRQMENAL